MRLQSIDEQLAALGRPGIVGLGLAAFAVALWVGLTGPSLEEVGRLESRLAREAREMESSKRQSGPVNTPASFYALLPTTDRLPDLIDTIRGLADAQSVRLERADSRIFKGKGALTRLEVSLPVKAAYPDVRRFIAGVLNTMPYVSLDSMSFARQRVGDPLLEAKLVLSVYCLDPERAGARAAAAGAAKPAGSTPPG